MVVSGFLTRCREIYCNYLAEMRRVDGVKYRFAGTSLTARGVEMSGKERPLVAVCSNEQPLLLHITDNFSRFTFSLKTATGNWEFSMIPWTFTCSVTNMKLNTANGSVVLCFVYDNLSKLYRFDLTPEMAFHLVCSHLD